MTSPPPFAREIFHVARVVIVLFGLVAASAAYWAVFGPESILLRPDNPRRLDAEANIQRGAIFDRDGDLLALTLREGGASVRRYFNPAAYSALGYTSSVHGSGGIEAELNNILRGDTLDTSAAEDITRYLLQTPQQGSDIRVTLALPIQEALYELIAEYRGAIVVLSVPDGSILGVVSAPQYDPNTIGSLWDTYRSDEASPLVNRAIQRAYPPGSMIQTPLLAAGMLLNVDVEAVIPDATAPVELGSEEIGCAVPLPPLELTLSEAYAFGCPAAFVQLGDSLGASAIQAVLDSFMLIEPPELMSSLTVTPSTGTASRLLSFEPSAETLGQGSVRVTPLMAALVAAAIVNDGNAPFPHFLQDVRPPGSTEWQPQTPVRPSLPMTTVETARRISDLMRRSVAQGAAQNAGRPDIDIGGHAGLAFYDNEPLTWFIGFATLGGRQGLAVAVVLEGVSDVGITADMGGSALASAQRYLQQRSAAVPQSLP